jgi:hypothetical protein
MGQHIQQIPKEIQEKLGLKPIEYKQFWANIGGKKIFFRSTWEYYYCLFLQKLKIEKKILDYDHEPQGFWFEGIKRGVRSYLPDFRVKHLNGTYEFVETKGYMDSKSQTKIKRMAKYHPHIKLRIVDSEWFKKNLKDIKTLEKFILSSH